MGCRQRWRWRRAHSGLGAAALALGIVAALAPAAIAANFTVNDLSDAHDADIPGTPDGTCDAAGADGCTLRAALEEAASNSESDVITISIPGTHLLTVGEQLHAVGELTLTGHPGGTTIDANEESAVLGIVNSAATTISDLTITGGLSDTQGAGLDIFAADATLNRVRVLGNSVTSTGGGGGAGIMVGTTGALTLVDSTVSGNTITGAGGTGAGVRVTGTAAIVRSTISGNDANSAGDGRGGGIVFPGDGTQSITSSTVSGNHAGTAGGGGVLAFGGTVIEVTNSTIAGNTTTGDGGGINSFSALELENTLLAGNEGSAFTGNCSAGGGVAAENSIADDLSCLFTGVPSNQEVAPAAVQLGPLAQNGGPTATRAIGTGSVARDAASDDCGGETIDQRGVARPNGAACDVGAFEFVPDTTAPNTIITAGPKPVVRTRRKRAAVVLRFRSTEGGSRFQCSLNRGAFRSCSSPRKFSLKRGRRHLIRIRAIDAAGNVDATPAVRRVRVVRSR